MKARKIRERVHWMGAVDWDRRLFDALIPLPDGTSYNAYLVQGSEKTALIDTADPALMHLLMAQLDDAPPVDVSLRDLGHARLLIAVNPDPRPKSAELYLDETRICFKVSAVFGNGDGESLFLPPGEPLRLWFEPFQVHVLMLKPADDKNG